MDFSKPLAAIQVRLEVLTLLNWQQWEAVKLLSRWQHPIDRYNLTYEEYEQLAEELRKHCKRAYKEHRNHE